jgi:hypothetical protein
MPERSAAAADLAVAAATVSPCHGLTADNSEVFPSGSAWARPEGDHCWCAQPTDADRWGIFFLPFAVGAHICRRHQPNAVAERLHLTQPVLRPSARFNTNRLDASFSEKRQYLPAPQLSANKHLP